MNATARNCLDLVAASWLVGAGSAAAAPVYDDAYTIINPVNEVRMQSGKKSARVNYSPQVALRLFGVEDGDAVKLKFRKGKKILFEKRRPLNVRGVRAISRQPSAAGNAKQHDGTRPSQPRCDLGG